MTSNQQKEELSVAYVHAVAARAGYACQVKTPDLESVDATLSAIGKVHEDSVIRSPRLDVQLKATASFELRPKELVYRLPLKNYRDLRQDSLVPKILVVLTLPKSPDDWIELSEERMIVRRCAYWRSLVGMPEIANSSNVSVRIPRSQQFSVDQLRRIMRRISRGEPL